MKSKIFLAFLVSLFFLHSHAQSWLKGSITGEGDVVKQEIKLDKFTGVSLDFSGDIFLIQGGGQKVVVEAQQNIIENIRRDVKKDVWHVQFEKNVRKAKPVKIYITVPLLSYVAVSGSGDIRSDGHFSNQDDLKLRVSGSGDIKMSLDARAVESSISGSGSITLAGSGVSNEIHISGSGDVDAADLKVQNSTVSISGSGDVKVYVTGDLDARISGSGDIRYRGDCNVKARVSGSGDVRKM